MKILKINCLIILLLFSSCSSIPKNTLNSCSIFEEKYLWYKHAKKTEKKWGTPVYLQLAIIKMESSFNRFAKPPRQKLFRVFLGIEEQLETKRSKIIKQLIFKIFIYFE